MNPEDELRDRLRQELGDPVKTDPTGANDPGWAAIEEAGDRRRRRDRRLVLAATAAAAVVVAALVLVGRTDRTSTTALRTGSGGTTVVPGSSTVGSATSATPSTGTEVPTTSTVPVTTLAPITVPATAPTTVPATTASTTPAGQIDCGTAYLASGWPTTILPSPALQQCILSAFAAGRPAIYRERAQTDGQGGHIKITTYEVIGVHQVRRTVDATGAQPPGAVTVSVCTGLASGQDGQLAASGCTPA